MQNFNFVWGNSVKLSTSLLATLALLCSSVAFASDTGFYFGLNVVDGQIDLQNTTVNNVTYSPDDGDSLGGGLTFGYNASKHFAIDAAFDAFDKVTYEGDNAPSYTYMFGYLAAKPMIDFWRFNAFVEVGGAYVNAMPDDDDANSHSQVRPYGGAGIGYNFTPNTELSFSMNRIQDSTSPITFGMLTLTYHAVTKYEDSGFLAD